MNPAAIETLRVFYVGNRQQLYTYAVSLTRQREAAEDAIHAAFQQLLRRGELAADLRPYIFRCVRNAALDALRRARVRGDSLFAVGPVPDPVAPADPAPGLARELDGKLAQLSPDERETIVLKIYDELTFQEIADLRDVPLPTVASWYRRGVEKLRNLMGETP
ncbi:MAG: sigma-70 family RNA polymerase sigma factor [Opitutae bacterium]|nr:sigma-70 family RNA polymerase sigma factor [Opitutae bacterium]